MSASDSADGLRVLLINNRSGKKWIIPKGILEPHMTMAASAAKEAQEEAGVIGRVYDEMVGEFSYEKWGTTLHVAVYILRVEDEYEDWEEAHFRKRRWLTPENAARIVAYPELAPIIERIANVLPGDGDQTP